MSIRIISYIGRQYNEQVLPSEKASWLTFPAEQPAAKSQLPLTIATVKSIPLGFRKQRDKSLNRGQNSSHSEIAAAAHGHRFEVVVARTT